MAQSIALISKLSLKTLKVKAAKFASATGTPIARIYGTAQSIKFVEDKINGTMHEALAGDFEGENLETHELFRSGVLYLPAGIHDSVASAVRALKHEGESVEFALEIRAVESTNKAGYAYEAHDLRKTDIVDPLTEMRKSFTIPSSAPALPAPEKTETPAVEKTETPAKETPAKGKVK